MGVSDKDHRLHLGGYEQKLALSRKGKRFVEAPLIQDSNDWIVSF
jgi:hypothetical protein